MAKSMMYKKVKITVDSVESKKEFNEKQSPAGKNFLVLNIEMKNTNPSYPVILFLQEEVSLLADKEKISPENFKIENNLDPGQEAKGHIYFVVPESAKKFKLQFAKAGGERADMDLKV